MKDRNNLQKKLFLSRCAACILCLIVLCFIFKVGPSSSRRVPSSAYIARIRIHGGIEHIEHRIESLKSLAKDKSVKAVLMHIDSPGGDPFASEMLYLHLKKIAEVKPLVTIIDGVAASGGYFAAVSSEKIYAQATSMAGSIGAISVSFDMSELMSKIGVKANIVRTSPMKAVPQPYESLNDRSREFIANVLDGIGHEFCDVVTKCRYKDKKQNVCNGMIYLGRDALKIGLIDEIGGEAEAFEWLKTKYNYADKIGIYDYDIMPLPDAKHSFFGSIAQSAITFLARSVNLSYIFHNIAV